MKRCSIPAPPVDKWSRAKSLLGFWGSKVIYRPAELVAALLLPLGNWNVQAIVIDFGALDFTVETPRIGFSELNGTPVVGVVSLDFYFANDQFVRLYNDTNPGFGAAIVLQTTRAGLVGFLHGTGYLIDANRNAIPGYAITGTASSLDGFMALALLPLLKDQDGTPNDALAMPFDFSGVHLNLIFPVVDAGIEITGGEFFLTGQGRKFPIGPNAFVPKMIDLSEVNDVIQITFRGAKGEAYQVQHSTDLTTWSVLDTIVMPSTGEYTYSDNSPQKGADFLRAVWVR